MAGLKGLICPHNGEHVDFSYCINHCSEKCHPLPLLIALNSTRPVVDKVYSVTEILNPPQVVYLKRNNDYYATFDSLIWMTMGTAWHKIPENAKWVLDKMGLGEMNRIEEGFSVKIGEYTLTGKLDYYDAITKTLWDYKTMKVYPVKKLKAGDFSDSTYKDQLNMYRAYKFPEATSLKIEAIIKDWSTATQHRDGVNPVETIDVPIMNIESVKNMAEGLVIEHGENQKDPSKITPCRVPEDTWYNENPRSQNYKVHLRCRDYCPVNYLCPQFKEIK